MYIMKDIISKYALLFVIIFIIISSSTKLNNIQNIILSAILLLCVYTVNMSNNKEPYNCTACTVDKFENLDDEKQDEEIKVEEIVNVDMNKNYKEYQETKEKEDLEELKSGNIFRMAIGNQNIVQPYLRDAKNYYQKIFDRSVNMSSPEELLDSELKYSDLNYVVPLNAGMINPEYTTVAPQNWFPIQPVPPVCVSADRTVTEPLSVVNNHMPFASLKDFNRARRFTGNMNINIDYIKNVLNDPKAGNR